MKESPIIFSGPMARAILDGRKTQTRRIIKQRPAMAFPMLNQDKTPRGDFFLSDPVYERVGTSGNVCPYGVPGDRLWVREKWQALNGGSYDEQRQPLPGCCDLRYAATDALASIDRESRGYRWRPSIHMPRWASRILLEITDVRVQQVQEISEEDAKAEGARTPDIIYPDSDPRAYFYVENFRLIWDSINAKRGCGWDANPWVWAITFKIIDAGRAA